MRGLKRLGTVIFVLADLFALAALTLTWYGPWTDAATALLYLEPYAIAVLACLAVSALGLVVLLARALFGGRRVRTVEVATVDGGVISVTRGRHSRAGVAHRGGGRHLRRRARARGRQAARARARGTCACCRTPDGGRGGQRASELHTRAGRRPFAAVCGGTVENVSLEFVEPESVTLAAQDEEPPREPAARDAVGGGHHERDHRLHGPGPRDREGGVGHGGREDPPAPRSRRARGIRFPSVPRRAPTAATTAPTPWARRSATAPRAFLSWVRRTFPGHEHAFWGGVLGLLTGDSLSGAGAVARARDRGARDRGRGHRPDARRRVQDHGPRPAALLS